MAYFTLPTVSNTVFIHDNNMTSSCLYLELPLELHLMILKNVHSVQNLLSLSQTCRTLRAICWDPKVKAPAIGHSAHVERVLSPHPELMLTGIARQLTDDIVEDTLPQHQKLEESKLNDVMHGGLTDVLTWAGQATLMNLKDISTLQSLREKHIDPMVKRHCDHHVSSPKKTRKALVLYWLYSELFYRNIENVLRPVHARRRELATNVRLGFIRYGIFDPTYTYSEKVAMKTLLRLLWKQWTGLASQPHTTEAIDGKLRSEILPVGMRSGQRRNAEYRMDVIVQMLPYMGIHYLQLVSSVRTINRSEVLEALGSGTRQMRYRQLHSAFSKAATGELGIHSIMDDPLH